MRMEVVEGAVLGWVWEAVQWRENRLNAAGPHQVKESPKKNLLNVKSWILTGSPPLTAQGDDRIHLLAVVQAPGEA